MGAQEFTAGAGAIRCVVNGGGVRQLLTVEAMAGYCTGQYELGGDGFYVFRVAPRGGNGWQYHAASCAVTRETKHWAGNVPGAFGGCRVTVAVPEKQKHARACRAKERK